MAIANTDMAATWDGDEGAHWTRHAPRYDASVRFFHPRLMAAAAIGPGERILDVGCGAGQVTRDAARTATDGFAMGVDLSSGMLAYAQERAREEGLANVAFERADAQVHPFEPSSFDLAISRNGVMFFADREAAFRNIARALRPGGRLTILAWQGLDRNQWLREMIGSLAAGRTFPPPQPGAPGPTSFADQEATRSLLAGAGFDAITFQSVEQPLWFGPTAADAYEFLHDAGFARGLMHGLDAQSAAAADKEFRAMLRRFETADGVMLDGAAWLITARRT